MKAIVIAGNYPLSIPDSQAHSAIDGAWLVACDSYHTVHNAEASAFSTPLNTHTTGRAATQTIAASRGSRRTVESAVRSAPSINSSRMTGRGCALRIAQDRLNDSTARMSSSTQALAATGHNTARKNEASPNGSMMTIMLSSRPGATPGLPSVSPSRLTPVAAMNTHQPITIRLAAMVIGMGGNE